MGYIKTGTDAAGNDIKVHYTDLGEGPTIVLMHGWPATHAMWEYQLAELPKHGYRVVAHTRRGFGLSDHPWDGYDYDTMSDDLKAVMDYLDLQDVMLVGFSMGGGEVARYMGRHNGARVAKVAFISAIPPLLVKSVESPDGVPKEFFDMFEVSINSSRFGYLTDFGRLFFNVGPFNPAVDQPTLDWMQSICQTASPRATTQCIHAWGEDFRLDLATITVPTLILHGSEDKVVPIAASGARMPDFIPHAQFIRYEGAPHGLVITEKKRVNRDLLAFAAGHPVSEKA